MAYLSSMHLADCRSLVLGRFMVGIGIGISAVVVPVYLGEVAPAQVSQCRVVCSMPQHHFHVYQVL